MCVIIMSITIQRSDSSCTDFQMVSPEALGPFLTRRLPCSIRLRLVRRGAECPDSFYLVRVGVPSSAIGKMAAPLPSLCMGWDKSLLSPSLLLNWDIL